MWVSYFLILSALEILLLEELSNDPEKALSMSLEMKKRENHPAIHTKNEPQRVHRPVFWGIKENCQLV